MIWYIEMAVVIERDGIRYRRTSVEVREDLHDYAREKGINMAGLLNKALEEKRKGGK
jgi:post-segregation antitoxin (ccd killing protein)